MKTSLYIQVDTDQIHPISLSKPSDQPQPETDEEAKVMIMNDITALTETVCLLINASSEKGFSEKNQLINAVIQRLEDLRG
jgi:hypothetical protein